MCFLCARLHLNVGFSKTVIVYMATEISSCSNHPYTHNHAPLKPKTRSDRSLYCIVSLFYAFAEVQKKRVNEGERKKEGAKEEVICDTMILCALVISSDCFVFLVALMSGHIGFFCASLRFNISTSRHIDVWHVMCTYTIFMRNSNMIRKISNDDWNNWLTRRR